MFSMFTRYAGQALALNGYSVLTYAAPTASIIEPAKVYGWIDLEEFLVEVASEFTDDVFLVISKYEDAMNTYYGSNPEVQMLNNALTDDKISPYYHNNRHLVIFVPKTTTPFWIKARRRVHKFVKQRENISYYFWVMTAKGTGLAAGSLSVSSRFLFQIGAKR
jgi:hypothetical protein